MDSTRGRRLPHFFKDEQMALVISRKSRAINPGKSAIRITRNGELVGRIEVNQILGGTVRIGLDLPKDFDIAREEICELGSDGKESDGRRAV